MHRPIRFLTNNRHLLRYHLLPFPPLTLNIAFNSLLEQRLQRTRCNTLKRSSRQLAMQILLTPLPVPLLRLIKLTTPHIMVPMTLQHHPHQDQSVRDRTRDFGRYSRTLLPHLSTGPQPRLTALPVPILNTHRQDRLDRRIKVDLRLHGVARLKGQRLDRHLQPKARLNKGTHSPRPTARRQLTAPHLHHRLARANAGIGRALVPIDLLRQHRVKALTVLRRRRLALNFRIRFTRGTQRPLGTDRLTKHRAAVASRRAGRTLTIFLIIKNSRRHLLRPLFLSTINRLNSITRIFTKIIQIQSRILCISVSSISDR